MKVQKILILSLICLVTIDVVGKELRRSESGKFFPNVEQRSILKGKILNINEFPNESKLIRLSVTDITVDRQLKFETIPDTNGNFVFDFPLLHAKDAFLTFNNKSIQLFVIPHDTLSFTCRIEKKDNQFRLINIKYDSLHVDFQNNFTRQYDWLQSIKLINYRNLDLSLDSIKKTYLEFEKRLSEKIDKRTISYSIGEPLSYFLKNHLKYKLYADLIKLGRTIGDHNEQKDFFSFLNEEELFNNKATTSSNYAHFLNNFRCSVEKPVYDDKPTNTKIELLKKLLDQAFIQRKGEWAEYLACARMYEYAFKENKISLSIIESYKSIIDSYFTIPYVKQILLYKCDDAILKINLTTNQTIPPSMALSKFDNLTGKVLFDKIINTHTGKVILIDIWATWCSPCIREFSHSQELYEKYKNKGISFVYLCSRSDEDSWERVIIYHQLKGDHYLLDKSQYEYFKYIFSLTGVPHYVLIDKSGNIAEKTAPKPSNEELSFKINTLLSEN